MGEDISVYFYMLDTLDKRSLKVKRITKEFESKLCNIIAKITDSTCTKEFVKKRKKVFTIHSKALIKHESN